MTSPPSTQSYPIVFQSVQKINLKIQKSTTFCEKIYGECFVRDFFVQFAEEK
jgi:hypothetical protein